MKKRKALQIGERDKAIFTYIGRYGTANAYQIHDVLFENRTIGRAKDRLTQLVKAGYLHSEITQARGKRERVYWIERKAAMEFEKSQRDKLEKGRPPEKELAHTLYITDVCNAIGKSHEITSFTHEHALKSLKVREELKFTHTPKMQIGDALISIAPCEGGYLEAGEYMIEIDGDYWGKRLTSKIESLRASNMPVLYVCFTDARHSYVSKAITASNIQVVHFRQL